MKTKVELDGWELTHLQMAVNCRINDLRKKKKQDQKYIDRLEGLSGKIARHLRKVNRNRNSAARASAPETDHLRNAEMSDPAGDTCPRSVAPCRVPGSGVTAGETAPFGS